MKRKRDGFVPLGDVAEAVAPDPPRRYPRSTLQNGVANHFDSAIPFRTA